MTVLQKKRVDFLRHIVNRVLASLNVPAQYIDDIRRAVGRAEDKYRFDAFSGDVRRLADYIKSRDFDELIMQAKAENKAILLEALKKILEEAKKAYSDIPEVVEAIDARLKELETGEREEAVKKLEAVEAILHDIAKQGFKVEFNRDEKKLTLSYGDKLNALITYDEKRRSYIMEYSIKDRVEFGSPGEIRDFIVAKLVDLVKQ
jgi:vacuolar-type H+-ATPase subunit H